MRFDPAGMTDDPDVRMAQSMMDYIFRRLALDYLDFETRSAFGIYTAEERARQLETGSYEAVEADEESPRSGDAGPVGAGDRAPRESGGVGGGEGGARRGRHSSTELIEAIKGPASDAPMCFTCGTKMRPAGSCYVCEGCGAPAAVADLSVPEARTRGHAPTLARVLLASNVGAEDRRRT